MGVSLIIKSLSYSRIVITPLFLVVIIFYGALTYLGVNNKMQAYQVNVKADEEEQRDSDFQMQTCLYSTAKLVLSLKFCQDFYI